MTEGGRRSPKSGGVSNGGIDGDKLGDGESNHKTVPDEPTDETTTCPPPRKRTIQISTTAWTMRPLRYDETFYGGGRDTTAAGVPQHE